MPAKTRNTRSTTRTAVHGARAGRMAAELPGATAVTLAHRLPLLVKGALDPASCDNVEIRRMVVEKADAGRKSSEALGRGAAAGGTALARYAQRQAQANAELLTGLLGAQPQTVLDRLGRHGRMSLELSTGMALRLMEIAAGTACASMTPAHRAVTGNARRLSRKRRKG